MIKKIFSLLARNIRIPLRYVKKFFLSVINDFSKPKKISNKNRLNLLVISPGGVATTTLIKHLKLYKKVNENLIKIKANYYFFVKDKLGITNNQI